MTHKPKYHVLIIFENTLLMVLKTTLAPRIRFCQEQILFLSFVCNPRDRSSQMLLMATRENVSFETDWINFLYLIIVSHSHLKRSKQNSNRVQSRQSHLLTSFICFSFFLFPLFLSWNFLSILLWRQKLKREIIRCSYLSNTATCSHDKWNITMQNC